MPVILQLVQQGKLALADKVSEFEPQIPNASKITIRELLNHTSGLQSNAPSIVQQILTNPDTPQTPQQVIAATTALPLLSTPGSAYHYSDTGYLILGEIASKVTGTDVGTLIQRQVLAPLGLRHTVYASGSTKSRDPATDHKGDHTSGGGADLRDLVSRPVDRRGCRHRIGH